MQLWVKSSLSVILNGWTWFYRVYFWDAHTPDVLYNKDRINILGLHLFGFCFPFPRYISWMLPIPFHFHWAPRGLSVCCKDWPNMSLFRMGHSQSLGTSRDHRTCHSSTWITPSLWAPDVIRGWAWGAEVGQQRRRGKCRESS